jgi:hypothetical protein
MTPIEIFALILAVLAVVKIIVLFANPKSWLSVVRAVYTRPVLTSITALILAALVLKYLLVELSIVQIFAVMLFLALLMVIGFAAYSKEMLELLEKILRDKNVEKAWLAIIVWLILVSWVLSTLFA